MSKNKKQFEVNLQMFNDGGASGADGAGASAAVAENTPKADVSTKNGSGRRSKSGEFDNVIFGKQESSADDTIADPAAGGNSEGAEEGDVITTSNTLEERRKAFEDLKNGEFKELFHEEVQKIINRRFKDTKTMEAELAKHRPIMEMLMSKYNVDDVAKLEKAINEDNDFWESLADERGLSVEQFKTVRKLEMENKALKAIDDQRAGRQRMQQQISEWTRQAQRVKELYPSFDVKQELQNPQFTSLLRNGIDMEHAYKLIHMDEITNNAAMYAAKTADAQAQARIKSKASRPPENGTSSQSAAVVRSSVYDLTPKERAEIARRVAEGEKISF